MWVNCDTRRRSKSGPDCMQREQCRGVEVREKKRMEGYVKCAENGGSCCG